MCMSNLIELYVRVAYDQFFVWFSTKTLPTMVAGWMELGFRRRCTGTRTRLGPCRRFIIWITGHHHMPTNTTGPTHRTASCPAAWAQLSTTHLKETRTKFTGTLLQSLLHGVAYNIYTVYASLKKDPQYRFRGDVILVNILGSPKVAIIQRTVFKRTFFLSMR